MNLENTLLKYATDIFTFKNICNSHVTYQRTTDSEIITIKGTSDYRSDLNANETGHSLSIEIAITDIKVNQR